MIDPAKIAEACERAEHVLRRERLIDWKVEVIDDPKMLGWCIQSRRTIQLTLTCIALGPEQVEDTIMHEVAHAIIDTRPHNYGHHALTELLKRKHSGDERYGPQGEPLWQ